MWGLRPLCSTLSSPGWRALSSASDHVVDVAIVGGSVAGAALAAALGKCRPRWLPSLPYERRPSFPHRSANQHLLPSAARSRQPADQQPAGGAARRAAACRCAPRAAAHPRLASGGAQPSFRGAAAERGSLAHAGACSRALLRHAGVAWLCRGMLTLWPVSPDAAPGAASSKHPRSASCAGVGQRRRRLHALRCCQRGR